MPVEIPAAVGVDQLEAIAHNDDRRAFLDIRRHRRERMADVGDVAGAEGGGRRGAQTAGSEC
jgi:hypothetical protein